MKPADSKSCMLNLEESLGFSLRKAKGSLFYLRLNNFMWEYCCHFLMANIGNSVLVATLISGVASQHFVAQGQTLWAPDML